ncbi:hypothetical protein NW759_015436 [Fusarium solani]|uniref:Fungal-specific transcription factor domain-containing protein n=1 Tax=Fusarium solani TaxID=169388 RepID=A0A9P9GK96_FUSSL|nr:fungal-specific transcription factor domain-containing protein [Fusarium solani]KAH7240486.1 fungal-specific transcription factor domain-containing protein [Fusarium solani]KAJ4202047.1 hypothetical protein NW759_015436 [Fusarium solani]
MEETPHMMLSPSSEARGGVETDAETPSILVATPSELTSSRSKRNKSTDEVGPGPHKVRKVSRACDFCKSRKARCTGDLPCAKCVAKGRECSYDAKYTRGRPPTPPPAETRPKSSSTGAFPSVEDISRHHALSTGRGPTTAVGDDLGLLRRPNESTVASRSSPELSIAEIQGQVFDSKSGLTFIQRALKRLSAQNKNGASGKAQPLSDNQSLMTAGDKPLPEFPGNGLSTLPDLVECNKLLALYFEVCIATYRMLHRPTAERWLAILKRNHDEGRALWSDIGRAEAAIVLAALAIARLHQEKSRGFLSAEDESEALRASDELYVLSTRFADDEAGFPRLEAAQAKVIHVLYLLTTSRFNRGWYVFGNALHLVTALGLYRRGNWKRGISSRNDYIHTQCGIRTFWTAYIVDNYLAVIFGRPRHFHDEDINQDLPESVDDEAMTVDGPINAADTPKDCHIDALIFHARIAKLVGSVSREVYTFRAISEAERVSAANRLIQRVREWHASLPIHLGSIPPSMLIPSYRRQATVLRLAHLHAILHANRLFLLGSSSNTHESQVTECIKAAKAVLETVDELAQEGPIFHAFWWTHYVTFCALVVTYVWEIRQRRIKHSNSRHDRSMLLELAERCHTHLANATASNSPSRRYAVILEEFRTVIAESNTRTTTYPPEQMAELSDVGQCDLPEHALAVGAMPGSAGQQVDIGNASILNDAHLFSQWNTTDWLDIDSSAFWMQMDTDESILWPDMG